MPAPLDGIRVLDFTWVISGPQCTQILADFGAEVIKAEWPHHLDGLRYRVQAPGSDPASPECSGLWSNLNRNKRSITLNMRHPAGAGVALDIIERCDVVVENFSPGVLDSWGLSWAALRERNPRLVYLGMSGFGRGGPNQDYVVFAPVMHALSGLHAMTGEPSREPAGLGFSYGDHVGGYFGALAILAALEERDATGQGAMIDLGQVEASLALTSTATLDHQVSRRHYVAGGNVPFGSADAPAGLYRCAGADAWCAISIRDDAQWRSLVQILGDEDLAADERFATRPARAAHRELLDDRLSEWTAARSRDEVGAVLGAAGIPCTSMATAADALTDERLRAHGYFQSARHDLLGDREFQMGPVRSAAGPHLKSAGPLVGEANDYVFGELLGLSTEEMDALRENVVI
jgi:crotonobetainyl-CoA:carnitine CoA-transferase CaiB-like acyl-CoA transferase